MMIGRYEVNNPVISRFPDGRRQPSDYNTETDCGSVTDCLSNRLKDHAAMRDG
jgi:hypothetical protein